MCGCNESRATQLPAMRAVQIARRAEPMPSNLHDNVGPAVAETRGRKRTSDQTAIAWGRVKKSGLPPAKTVVINKGIKSCSGVRLNDIVPVAMKRVAFQIHSFHLFVRDSPPGWIFPTIQVTLHCQSFGRGRFGN